MEGHTCVLHVFLGVKVEPLYNWGTVYHSKTSKYLIDLRGGNNKSPISQGLYRTTIL